MKRYEIFVGIEEHYCYLESIEEDAAENGFNFKLKVTGHCEICGSNFRCRFNRGAVAGKTTFDGEWTKVLPSGNVQFSNGESALIDPEIYENLPDNCISYSVENADGKVQTVKARRKLPTIFNQIGNFGDVIK